MKSPPEADTSELFLCSYCGRGLQNAGGKLRHEKACARNPAHANYIAGGGEDLLRCNKKDGRHWRCSEPVYQNGTKCLKHQHYEAKRNKRCKKSGKQGGEGQGCEKEEENREKKGKQNSAEVVQG